MDGILSQTSHFISLKILYSSDQCDFGFISYKLVFWPYTVKAALILSVRKHFCD